MGNVIGGDVLLRRGYSPLQVDALRELARREDRNVRIRQIGGTTTLQWSERGGIGQPYDQGHLQMHKQLGITGRPVQMQGEGGIWEVFEPGYTKSDLTGPAERVYVLPIRPKSEKQSISFNPFQKPLGGNVSEGVVRMTGPNVSKIEKIRVEGLTQDQLVARQRLLSAEMARGIPEEKLSVPWQYRSYFSKEELARVNAAFVEKQRAAELAKQKKAPLGINLFGFSDGFGANWFKFFGKGNRRV